jgi:hypothetical protein
MLDAQAAFVPFLDATAAADEPVVFLRSASSHLRAVPTATPATSPATAQPATAQPATTPHSAEDLAPALSNDTRPVTPRRPLRFSSARSSEDTVAVTLPVANLFTGVFDEDDLATADVDPRLARSRQRARAILAAREAALPAEEANLWHDFTLDPAPAPTLAPLAADPATIATTDAARSARTRSGRPVRHLTSADLRANRLPETPEEDPLQTHLHRVRDALYAPDPEGDAAAAAAAAHLSLPARCTAHAFNLALLVTALPLGAAMMVYTFLRGEDLRLSARMVAVAGTAVTVMQLGLDRFI